MSKFKVVFCRHGESEWTKDNLFCGWVDVNLTAKGREEAELTGKALVQEGLKFDKAYTSLLKRAHQSLDIIQKLIDQPNLQVIEAWQLNERHYGALTGYNKAEMAEKYGEKQVQIWRRSFDVLPPPMKETHKYYSQINENPKFANIKDKIPETESLKTTMLRAVPYWTDVIAKDVKDGKRILVVAHGTSLRAIVKHLDNISDEDILKLNIPTGIPFVYELDENLQPVVSLKFLSDEETVRKAMEKVAGIGKKSEKVLTGSHISLNASSTKTTEPEICLCINREMK